MSNQPNHQSNHPSSTTTHEPANPTYQPTSPPKPKPSTWGCEPKPLGALRRSRWILDSLWPPKTCKVPREGGLENLAFFARLARVLVLVFSCLYCVKFFLGVSPCSCANKHMFQRFQLCWCPLLSSAKSLSCVCFGVLSWSGVPMQFCYERLVSAPAMDRDLELGSGFALDVVTSSDGRERSAFTLMWCPLAGFGLYVRT